MEFRRGFDTGRRPPYTAAMTVPPLERLPTFVCDAAMTTRLAQTRPAPLTYAGARVLRQPARAVALADIGTESMQQLIATMVCTMRHAPGVGLAAPQIGVDLSVAVIEDTPAYVQDAEAEHNRARGRVAVPLCVLINPQVKRLKGGKEVSFAEGCLSVPNYLAEVRRELQIEVSGLDAHGKPFVWRPSGWPARIVQHECDHLRGVLYVDRMASKTLTYAP